MATLRTTRPALHLTALRVLAALPLVWIGSLHLIGYAPMRPILDGMGSPVPGLMNWLVPILEVVGGTLLLVGFQARIGALLVLGPMLGAIVAHLVHDWADEPTILLPGLVLLGVFQVLWGGAGSFSADLAASPRNQ